MKRRIVSLLMCFVMTFGMLPTAAWAELIPAQGETEENASNTAYAVGEDTAVQSGEDGENSIAVLAASANEAEYNGKEYVTLAEAFAAAEKDPGGTVTVLKDVVLDKEDGTGIAVTCEVTLDLNGKTISTAKWTDESLWISSWKYSVFWVKSGGDLTIMDSAGGGEIVQPNDNPVVVVDDKGTLTVNSGTLKATKADGNGNYLSGYRFSCAVMMSGDGAKAYLNGGEFSGGQVGVIMVGDQWLYVTGGTFHGETSSALWVTGTVSDEDVTLSGGTYTTAKGENSITNDSSWSNKKVVGLLADGYQYADANDDTIAVTSTDTGIKGTVKVKPAAGVVEYVGEGGTTQVCTSYEKVTSTTDSLTDNTWYVVEQSVELDSLKLNIGTTANLILCDAATLTVNKDIENTGPEGSKTLNVYLQKVGTGTLNVKGGVSILSDITIKSPGTPMKIVNAKGEKVTDLTKSGFTVSKCEHEGLVYTAQDETGHTGTCDLCGTTVSGKHSYGAWEQNDADTHKAICGDCGFEKKAEHDFEKLPLEDGKHHSVTCRTCNYQGAAAAHTYAESAKDEYNRLACTGCGVFLAAEYNGEQYALLQAAIDAAKGEGGTVKLAQFTGENVTVTDGSVTIDLNNMMWGADLESSPYVPLTVTGGSVTLQNGMIYQSGNYQTVGAGVVINGGSVTVKGDASIHAYGGSVDVQSGELILEKGAALLSGLKVPEGKVLADYLPGGTAFTKCTFDGTSTSVSSEYVPNVYTANVYDEGMYVAEHRHQIINKKPCECGYTCDHSAGWDENGACKTCGTTAPVQVTADGKTTYYAEFADAITYANGQKDCTVTLRQDVEVSYGTYVTGPLTLDLNGHKADVLTVGEEVYKDENGNSILDKTIPGYLTIVDNSTDKTGAVYSLTLKAGTLNISDAYVPDLACESGTVTASGHIGDDERTLWSWSIFGTLTINEDVTVGEANLYSKDGGSITITGGKFNKASLHNNGGSFAISGGTFKQITSFGVLSVEIPLMNLLAKGYAFCVNDDIGIDVVDASGTTLENVTVKTHKHHIESNGKCACGIEAVVIDSNNGIYGTLQSALDAAAKDSSIEWVQLGQDVTEEVTFNGGEAAVTLDMNGKTLTCKDGSPLTVNSGKLTVKGEATIKHERVGDAASSFPAIKITGGELVFEGVLNAEGSVGRTDHVQKPGVLAEGGVLEFKQAVQLLGGLTMKGDAELRGGLKQGSTFTRASQATLTRTIDTSESKKYKNLRQLLESDDKLAYWCDSASEGPVLLKVADNYDWGMGDYTVITHTHTYKAYGSGDSDGAQCACGKTCDHYNSPNWKNGVCTLCGVTCLHREEKVDKTTYTCDICKAELAASVTDGENTTYYVGLSNALRAAGDGENGTYTVTLLRDAGMYLVDAKGRMQNSFAGSMKAAEGGRVVLDLNGHTITGNSEEYPTELVVGDGNGYKGDLTIKGSGAIEKSVKVVVYDGTLTMEADAGTIGKLNVTGGTVALSGGTYGAITASSGVKVGDLLAKGYAFKGADGFVEYAAEANGLADVSVVTCEHGSVDGKTGVCKYCGTKFAARVVYNGQTRYVETLESNSFTYSSTVTLFADSNTRPSTFGTCGIDLNGYNMTGCVFVKGTTTIMGKGQVKEVRIGEIGSTSSSQDTPGTLRITNDDVTVGTMSVNCNGETKLEHGTFEIVSIKASGLTAGALLAEGYAFYGKDENGEYTKLQRMDATALADVKVLKHTHQYTGGVCECGMKCDHRQYWQNGVCTECGEVCLHTDVDTETYICNICKAELAASLTVKTKNGTTTDTTYYVGLADALNAANEATGDTIKVTLLRPTALTSVGAAGTLNADANVTLTKAVSLYLEGHPLTGGGSITAASGSTLKVYTVKGAGIAPTLIATAGGTLELSYFTSSDKQPATINAVEINGGTLQITQSTFKGTINTLTLTNPAKETKITSGTFGKIIADAGLTAADITSTDPYVFQKADGSYVKRTDPINGLENVTVVECLHREIDENRLCTICGEEMRVKVTAADGSVRHFKYLTTTALSKGVVTLLTDTSTGYLGSNPASGTIDLNGHNLTGTTLVQKTLTLQNSGAATGTVTNLILGEDEIYGEGTLVIDSDNITVTKLEVVKNGETKLTHGTFGEITVTQSDLTAIDLLAEGYAFADADAKIVNGNVTTLTNVHIVAHAKHDGPNCECGYECKHTGHWQDGECQFCGYKCPHESAADNGEGVWSCSTCGQQMVASVTLNSTTAYTADLKAALENAASGAVVTLLADANMRYAEIYGTDSNLKTVTLDLNGHSITSQYSIKVGDIEYVGSYGNTTVTPGELIVKGKGNIQFNDGYGILVAVKSTLDLSGWTGGTISCVDISDNSSFDKTTREPSLIVGSGAGAITTLIYRNWRLDNVTETKLSGGTYGKISKVGDQGEAFALGKLLKEGYAFKNADGTFLPCNTTLETGESIENVTVVECPHEKIEDGRCVYCNETYAAKVDSTAYKTYDEAQTAWLASGGTLTLYQDVDNMTSADWTGASGKTYTLDLNGYKIADDAMYDDNSGQYAPSWRITVSNMALTVKDGSEAGDGQVDNLSLSVSSSLTLESGWLGHLTVPSDETVTVSLQGGGLKEGFETVIPVAYLLADGYDLKEMSDLSSYGTGNLQTYTVQKSDAAFDGGKTGTMPNGRNKLPFAPTATMDEGAEEPKQIAFAWYLWDGTDVRNLANTYLFKNGTDWVYKETAASPTAYDGLTVGSTYNVFAVAEATDIGGARLWRAALNGYELEIGKGDLRDAQVVLVNTNAMVFAPSIYDNYKGLTLTQDVSVVLYDKTLNAADYVVSGNTGTDAGDYKLTVSAAEGSTLYTGSTEADWSIAPFPLDYAYVKLVKKYDGTKAVDKDAATVDAFRGVSGTQISGLEKGKDYELSDISENYPDAEQGLYTGMQATVTLKNPNYVFADGTMVYKWEQTSPGSYCMIDYADAPADVNTALTVMNDHAGTYTLDVSKLLPALATGCSYGEPTHYLLNDYSGSLVALDSRYYDEGKASIDGNGLLTLPIKTVESSTEGSIGTVTVKVDSRNYDYFNVVVTVNAVNKLIPTGAPTLDKTTITYGETVSSIGLSGSMTAGGETVKGTFTWDAPKTMPGAQSGYQAAWTFTPEDAQHYQTAHGTVSINVKQATLTGVSVEQVGTLTYNGSAQAATVETKATTVDRDSVEFRYSTLKIGSYAAKMPEFTNAGTYTVYYEAVDPAMNHEPVGGSFTVTIEKQKLNVLRPDMPARVYDGTTDAALTEVKFYDFSVGMDAVVTLDKADYTISNVHFETPDVGTQKRLSFTVKINNGNYILQLRSGKLVTEETYEMSTDAEGQYTITPAVLTDVQVSAEMLTYNGKAQTANVTVTAKTVDNTGVTVTYSAAQNGEYGAAVPAFTDAGDHTVYYKVSAKNHEDVYDSVTVVIDPLSITDAEVELGESLTYNGKEQTQTIASVKVGDVEVTSYTVKNNTGRAAREYTMTITAGSSNFTGSVEKKFTIGQLNIENAVITLGESLTYTGLPQTQTIASVKVGELAVDTFDVADAQQVNAGTYTLTVTGTKNFTGTAEKEFTIAPKTIVDGDVQVDSRVLTYTGKAQTPAVTLVGLVRDKDYTVAYENNTNAGTAKLTVSGQGNYDGKVEKTFAIGKASLTVTAEDKSVVYGADAPEYTVSYGGFVNGEDAAVLGGALAFECSYAKGSPVTEFGYPIAVKGLTSGNYDITFAGGTLSVVRAEGQVTVASVDAKTYGDAPFALEVDTHGSDGAVTFESSDTNVVTVDDAGVVTIVNAGSAVISVKLAKGSNHVAAQTALTVTVQLKTLTTGDVTKPSNVTFNGQPQQWQPVVTDGEKTLVENVDYTVSYDKDDFTNVAGQITVTVTGMGNYTGAVARSYKVTPKAILDGDVQVDSRVLTYTGKAQTPQVTVTGLVRDKDYAVAYENNVNAGTGKVTVTGQGNYDGRVEKTFAIGKAALTVTAEDKSVVYGKDAPEFTAAYSGFVNGEDAAVLGGALAFECSYAKGSPVAEFGYPITVKGLTSGNYDITFAGGTLSVVRAEGQVTVASVDAKTYGDAPFALEVDTHGSDGAVTFESSDTNVVTVDDAGVVTIVNAGSAVISVKLAKGSNYVAAQTAVEIDVARKDIADAVIELGESLTYNGGEQTQTVTSVTADGLDVTYTVSGEKQVNAGTYTLTVTGTGNFTGTAEKRFTIARKDIANAVVAAADVVYNGTAQTPVITAVEADGLALGSGDYTAAIRSAVSVGVYPLTVTGTGNFTGTAEGTFAIVKAAAPAVNVRLDVTNGYAAEYTVDLRAALDQALPAGSSFGTLRYGAVSFADSMGYCDAAETAVSASGVLTLPVKAVDTGAEGRAATVTVAVNSGNFEDMAVTVTLCAVNKTVPSGKPNPSHTKLNYGEALNSVTLSGNMWADGKFVPGTFAWKEPNLRPAVGSYTAEWVFTPDRGKYAAVTGTIELTVVQPVEPTYTVGGIVKAYSITGSGSETLVSGVVVTIRKGLDILGGQKLTDENGVFSLEGVIAGVYNVVVEYNGKTVTQKVEIIDHDVAGLVVAIPQEDVNSKLDIKSSGGVTDEAVVGGLDKEAGEQFKDEGGADPSGGSVSVKMELEEKPENKNDAAQNAIREVLKDKVTDFIEMSLTLVQNGETKDLTETKSVLEIIISYDTSRAGITVVRHHGDTVETFRRLDDLSGGGRDMTFYVDTENRCIHIFASKFSTYAISSETQSGGSGSSGGSVVIEGNGSPATGDVGLLPYAALALSGCTGIVLTFRRKRKDD